MNSEKIKSIGKEGEKVALNYLINHGYIVAETNYWSRFGEIDIIFRDQNSLVFTEVKSSSDESGYFLGHRVDTKKQKRIIATALDYLSKHNSKESGYRFDVILLQRVKAGEWKIEHIKDAFRVEESSPFE